jgi:hypothetical protein
MVLEKFNYIKILPKIPLFALFGAINLGCYGLSLFMSQKDYEFYFGYKGNGRYSDFFRALFGSNNFNNAIWTGPALIALGLHMHGKVGALTMAKFTPIALLSIATFWAAFSPNPNAALFPNIKLFNLQKFKFDS